MSRPQKSERMAEKELALLVKREGGESGDKDTRPVVISRLPLKCTDELARDWAAQLRDRLIEKVQTKDEIRFFYSMVQQEVRVTAAGPDYIAIEGVATELRTRINIWTKLDIKDAVALAGGMAKKSDRTDQATLAFFLLASGKKSEAKEPLHRAGTKGDEVAKLFSGTAVADR